MSCPQIPDDWLIPSKNTNQVACVPETNAVATNTNTATSVRKRKRPAAKPRASAETEAGHSLLKPSMHEEPSAPMQPTPCVDTSSLSPKKHCDETESVLKGLFFQVQKLGQKSGSALDEGIHLDSIMTHIPYADVLQQMFGGNTVSDTACVPVVTRSYEESFMREAISSSETPCIMGNNCECQFIDEHNPFVGVAFTLPVDVLAKGGSMVEELASNKMCVMCCRKNTQALFYDALYNHRAYSGVIQLYGNICDCPNEYAKEAMLICPLSGPINNMPIPIVAHQRNRYSVVVYNGVRQLRQHRVGYEDFHVLLS